MIVLANTGGVAWTNCFLVADEASRQAVMFDAPDHTVTPLLEETRKRRWNVIGLWLTHGHFDHFADHAVVKKQFPTAPVLLHRLDAPKARNPDMQTRLFGLAFSIPPLVPDGHVEDQQELKIGRCKVQVLYTPGHSPGHVGYYFPEENLLIGGDLIIGGSVGRTDLPDSSPEDLRKSIRRVMALPPETRLLGGHGPETTLAEERESNVYVGMMLR
jgi:glyoxylase-like metal-dependent hydrolase (beta-lactamase superfamily II)